MDGATQTATLGTPNRLKTIYRINLNTARAHQRYNQQIKATKDLPYWQYDAINDSRTRPSHAELDGSVFKFDDPFWQTHYPPNGWNCRCTVRALTAKQVKDQGLTILKTNKKNYKGLTTQIINNTTGEVIDYKNKSFTYEAIDGSKKTLIPDNGWAYNPGANTNPLLPNKNNPQVVKNQPTAKSLKLQIN